MLNQLMKRSCALALWATLAGAAQSQDLAITEISDATLPGGQPKFVEITNVGNVVIPDLSISSFGNYNNGSLTLTPPAPAGSGQRGPVCPRRIPPHCES